LAYNLVRKYDVAGSLVVYVSEDTLLNVLASEPIQHFPRDIFCNILDRVWGIPKYDYRLSAEVHNSLKKPAHGKPLDALYIVLSKATKISNQVSHS